VRAAVGPWPDGDAPAPSEAGANSAAAGRDLAGEARAADAALVLEVARALWERLETYRARSEGEAAALGELRENYPARLARAARATPGAAPLAAEGAEPEGGAAGEDEAVAVARLLVLELAGVARAAREARAAEHRLHRAFYSLLTHRHGERPEFAEFKPETPDYTSLLIGALLLNANGAPAAAREALDEYRELTARVEAGAGLEHPAGGASTGPEAGMLEGAERRAWSNIE